MLSARVAGVWWHGRYELGLQEAGGLTRPTFVIFFLAFANLYAVRTLAGKGGGTLTEDAGA